MNILSENLDFMRSTDVKLLIQIAAYSINDCDFLIIQPNKNM